jgi:hypothetical protein
VGLAAFAVGRSSAADESSAPPVPPSPSEVVKVERVFVDRIPAVCAAAISFAQFTYNRLTDPEFRNPEARFSHLPVDSPGWHQAATDLAFQADGIYSLDLGQVLGPPKSIHRCWFRWVDQDKP